MTEPTSIAPSFRRIDQLAGKLEELGEENAQLSCRVQEVEAERDHWVEQLAHQSYCCRQLQEQLDTITAERDTLRAALAVRQ